MRFSICPDFILKQEADTLNAIKAGGAYFVLAFLCGFVLGALRVIIVAPRIGSMAALLLEAPIILVISWIWCLWCLRRFQVGSDLVTRSLMGGTAFALLQAAELCVSVLVFSRSVAEHLAGYASLPGATGLVAQIVFAVFPILITPGQASR